MESFYSLSFPSSGLWIFREVFGLGEVFGFEEVLGFIRSRSSSRGLLPKRPSSSLR